MQQRVSLITLGVGDVQRARAFYEALGWRAAAAEGDDVVFFEAGGMVIALWERTALAADAGIVDPGGFCGVALAHVVDSPQTVDEVLEEARAAGATVTQPGEVTLCGSYSGAFTDPDGHLWEVAHNPFWRLDDDGAVRVEPA